MDEIYKFDLAVFDLIKDHIWNGILDPVMAVVSFTGEGGAIWILLALILLVFKKTRKTALMMGAALIIMLVLNDIILKPLIARPRPFDFAGWTNFIYPNIAFKIPTSYSFPSGHTAAAFACAIVLLLRDVRIGLPAFLYAFIMGFSRIYLFDHYCTDVIAGVFVGMIYGLIGYYIVKVIADKIDWHNNLEKEFNLPRGDYRGTRF